MTGTSLSGAAIKPNSSMLYQVTFSSGIIVSLGVKKNQDFLQWFHVVREETIGARLEGTLTKMAPTSI
jgi:hypothetical protein